MGIYCSWELWVELGFSNYNLNLTPGFEAIWYVFYTTCDTIFIKILNRKPSTSHCRIILNAMLITLHNILHNIKSQCNDFSYSTYKIEQIQDDYKISCNFLLLKFQMLNTANHGNIFRQSISALLGIRVKWYRLHNVTC